MEKNTMKLGYAAKLLMIGLLCVMLCVGGVSANFLSSIFFPGPERPVFSGTYTEDDRGTTKCLAEGAWFIVSLAENQTTGYVWDLTCGKDFLIVGSAYKTYDNPSDIGGVIRVHEWYIRIIEGGYDKITAVLRKGADIDKYYYLNIDARTFMT